MKKIPEQSVDMIFCDLPYGTTQCKWDVVIPFEKLWEQYRRITKGAIVLTACQPFTSALVMSSPKMFRYEWIWEKNNATGFLDAKKRPLNNYESVLVFCETAPPYHPQMTKGKMHTRGSKKPGRGGEVYSDFSRRQTTKSDEYYPKRILQFPVQRRPTHPTQKPVELVEYMIRTYTTEGDTVLDNCMGSGTTGVACRNTNRGFIGIEQDLKYFRIAEERIYSLETAVEKKSA
jgi:DNA modification methylase